MSRQLTLALLDAAAGIYFVVYALRGERRDEGAVMVVGIFLLLCAAALGWLALPDRGDEPTPRPAPLGRVS